MIPDAEGRASLWTGVDGRRSPDQRTAAAWTMKDNVYCERLV